MARTVLCWQTRWCWCSEWVCPGSDGGIGVAGVAGVAGVQVVSFETRQVAVPPRLMSSEVQVVQASGGLSGRWCVGSASSRFGCTAFLLRGERFRVRNTGKA